MNKLLDNFPGIATHYMLVAEGNVYETPTAVQTVLGSCVSVTFFSPKKRIGAMFHALMPRRSEYERLDNGAPAYRYVDSAIEAICQRLFQLGVRQQDVECKIFGGANAMFQHELSIGPKNVRTAFEVLASYPLRIAATHVGGNVGRKLFFISHTGEVYVKQLKKNERKK